MLAWDCENRNSSMAFVLCIQNLSKIFFTAWQWLPFIVRSLLTNPGLKSWGMPPNCILTVTYKIIIQRLILITNCLTYGPGSLPTNSYNLSQTIFILLSIAMWLYGFTLVILSLSFWEAAYNFSLTLPSFIFISAWISHLPLSCLSIGHGNFFINNWQ